MAAEVSSMPVNGNYAPHQGYGGLEQQNNNYMYGNSMPAPSSAAVTSATPSTAGSSAPQTAAPSKDEVGWYFVEQYYTTLSRNPEKVYLFYNKRSQFVSGQETDKVQVCVGQRAINDRIKELEFQDTKVRVTNVDSQASDSNIVIQVIGEISNKSQPHRKFVQTFILATQTNGYFVLNDIFRYLIDEEDEPEQEAAPAQQEEVQQAPVANEAAAPLEEAEPKTLSSSNNAADVETGAQKLDQLLETRAQGETNGVAPSEESKQAEDTPAASEPTVPEPAAEKTEPAATELSKTETKDADLQPEKPADPEPTPVATPPKQAPTQPAAAPKPAAPPVPKTWASLAASANKVATPAAPSSSASSQTSQQPKTAPVQNKPAAATTTTTQAAPISQTPPAPAAQREQSPAASSQDEWTAVGGSHNRQQSRQVNQQQQQQQGPQTRGYMNKVFEAVREDELKSTMEKFGEVIHCDVSRAKTPEAYNAAVAANPHIVNGERLYLQERRTGPGPNFVGRGGAQGGPRGGRGGPQGGQGRGGAQQGGRGSFQGPRGGRGGPAPRGGGTSMHT